MRAPILLCTLLLGSSLGAALPVCASEPPALVVPGRPDVPVIINGVDASWCVVNGDWGLDRPGAVAPTLICPAVTVLPDPGQPRAYYPRDGHAPRVGRLEVQPHRPQPRTSETFYRVWTIGPEKLPATEYPKFETPSVILEPQQNSSATNPTNNSTNNPANNRRLPQASHR